MGSTQILTNATTGNSAEFQCPDGSLIFRLVIVGDALIPINAFSDISSIANNLTLKISGITGSGATVKLQVKTNNSNDSFSDTGESWSADFAGIFYLQNNR